MSGYALTAAGALGISMAPILFALSGADASTGALYRYAYALPPLLLWCGLHRRTRAAFRRPGWIGLALASGLFFGLDMVMWHHSIELLGAGPATLLANTQVIWITLFGVSFLGERPSVPFWLALPVLAVGMAVMCGWTTDGFARAGDARGLGLGVASGVMYAGALLCLREARRRAAIAAAAALCVQLIAALALVASAAWLEGARVRVDADAHLWLLLLGLGPQLVGWMCITAGLPRAPSYVAGVVLTLQPVASLVWGWWILDQALTPARWVGAVLVVGGIVIALSSTRVGAVK